MAKATAQPKKEGPPMVGGDMEHIKNTIQSFAKDWIATAPVGYSIDKLKTAACATVINSDDLWRCDMRSFLSSLYHCCQVGLYPGDRGHCFIIARKSHGILHATYQTGYKGYVELAWRSKMIEKFEARVVLSDDHFECEYGTKPFIKHPLSLATGGKMVAAYAVAWLRDVAEPTFAVMLPDEIKKIKDFARASSQYSPWNTWESEMWKKSACNRLCKLLPASPEMSYAVARDSETEGEGEQLMSILEDAKAKAEDELEDVVNADENQEEEPTKDE